MWRAVHAELQERQGTAQASLGRLQQQVDAFRSSLGLSFDVQEGACQLQGPLPLRARTPEGICAVSGPATLLPALSARAASLSVDVAGSEVLRLTFTQISASDPERTFSAGVRASQADFEGARSAPAAGLPQCSRAWACTCPADGLPGHLLTQGDALQCATACPRCQKPASWQRSCAPARISAALCAGCALPLCVARARAALTGCVEGDWPRHAAQHMEMPATAQLRRQSWSSLSLVCALLWPLQTHAAQRSLGSCKQVATQTAHILHS